MKVLCDKAFFLIKPIIFRIVWLCLWIHSLWLTGNQSYSSSLVMHAGFKRCAPSVHPTIKEKILATLCAISGYYGVYGCILCHNTVGFVHACVFRQSYQSKSTTRYQSVFKNSSVLVRFAFLYFYSSLKFSFAHLFVL